MHLGTRSLTLTVGGVSRTGDVSDCRITSGPSEIRRLCHENRTYRLQGVAAQDPTEGSLWDLVWNHAGEQIDIDLRPAGGVAVSNDQPSFTGTVRVTEPDGDILGGTAATSVGARFTFAFDWEFLRKPDRSFSSW